MFSTHQAKRVLWLCSGMTLLCGWATGCQSTIGGQTLPSAHYLRDDLQYYPPGPEFLLTRQVEAIEEYKLRQQGITVNRGVSGVGGGGAGGVNGNGAAVLEGGAVGAGGGAVAP